MAAIIPFRGLRYSPGAGPMDELITPPYDVIDAGTQKQLYEQNPYNIIRLEYGKVEQKDGENNNRYSRAEECFSAWKQDGILRQEKAPAIYHCQEEFIYNGLTKTRNSFICGVKIEPYKNGVVLPHEETMPRHKADRLALMQSCQANFSPIFGLYADTERNIEKLLNEENDSDPNVSFTDKDGRRHRMWVVTNNAIIEKVKQLMANQRIFIADGHHRYETSLNYRNLRREQESALSGEYSFDYVMMSLVNLYDPGLVVLPTHRLIRNISHLNLEDFLACIGQYFVVEEFDRADNHHRLQHFLDALGKQGQTIPQQTQSVSRGICGHNHVFGLYTGSGRLYLLTLRKGSILSDLMPQSHSSIWNSLDVSVLHYLILKKILGIQEEQWTNETCISYVRQEKEIMPAVDEGDYDLAFFLNPTLVEEVTSIATGGERMPPKSTFFYPKLITGLVINQL